MVKNIFPLDPYGIANPSNTPISEDIDNNCLTI